MRHATTSVIPNLGLDVPTGLIGKGVLYLVLPDSLEGLVA